MQIGFLDSLPFSLNLEGRGVLVVHAGLKPGRDLGGQRLRDLTLLRECRPVGELISNSLHAGKVNMCNAIRLYLSSLV